MAYRAPWAERRWIRPRCGTRGTDTDGLKKFVRSVGSAIGGAASSAYDWASSGVKRVVDAVVSAGESLAGIMKEIGSWTKAKIRDLISALVEAGKSVHEILDAAVEAGTAMMEKVVEALLRVGQPLFEVLRWIGRQGASRARRALQAVRAAGRAVRAILDVLGRLTAPMRATIVSALRAIGQSVLQIIQTARLAGEQILRIVLQAFHDIEVELRTLLSTVAGASLAVLRDVLRALLRLGARAAARLQDIVAAALRLTRARARQIVRALVDIGQQVGRILQAAGEVAASAARTLLEGVFAAGINLTQTVAAIFRNVQEAFRESFVRGLLALKRAPLDILKAAAKTAASMVGLVLAVLMDIWGGHRGLTEDERREALKIFGSSIDLDRVKIAVGSFPADVANWLNGDRPFVTMHVINFASWVDVEDKPHVLIHELTHVWQAAVDGPVYMVEALHSQVFGRGYEVTAQDLANAQGDIRNLEREQQAVVVERYWHRRWGGGRGDWRPYEALARQVHSSGGGHIVRRPVIDIPTIRDIGVRPLPLRR